MFITCSNYKIIYFEFKKIINYIFRILLFLILTKGFGISFVTGLNLKPLPPHKIKIVKFF